MRHLGEDAKEPLLGTTSSIRGRNAPETGEAHPDIALSMKPTLHTARFSFVALHNVAYFASSGCCMPAICAYILSVPSAQRHACYIFSTPVCTIFFYTYNYESGRRQT
jgi:hypothetical protein